MALPKCGANAKSHDGTCANPAGYKTQHVGFGRCHIHGGNSPAGVKAAQKAMAEHHVARYGLPVEINPTDALLEEVHRTAGHVRWLADQIRTIEPDALTWGVTQRKQVEASEFPGTDVTEAAAINVWLDLYHTERKHLIDVCKAAITVGIEERRVKLAELQGEIAGEAIRAILAGLNLTVAQQQLVPDLVREHLAELRIPD